MIDIVQGTTTAAATVACGGKLWRLRLLMLLLLLLLPLQRVSCCS